MASAVWVYDTKEWHSFGYVYHRVLSDCKGRMEPEVTWEDFAMCGVDGDMKSCHLLADSLWWGTRWIDYPLKRKNCIYFLTCRTHFKI